MPDSAIGVSPRRKSQDRDRDHISYVMGAIELGARAEYLNDASLLDIAHRYLLISPLFSLQYLVSCAISPIPKGMQRDGRTLDHQPLEEIRRMAVRRVREGKDPSTVIAS